jgi:sugar phosphate isomerase/epimerase
MNLCFSIASWSFHGLLESGKQDMFKYITDCKELGCGLLDPWNGHLTPLIEEDKVLKSGADASQATFSPTGLEYVAKVKAAADAAGMPFGCLAVDGAHMWEPTAEARHINQAAAYRWLDVARRLSAPQVRMDSGGTPEMPDEMFDLIVEGFRDIVKRARDMGIEMVIENHWGASRVPENVLRMLKAVDGLGLLFDSGNFVPERREDGWTMLTPYARAVHIKTFTFDENGNDPIVDVPRVVRMLVDAGYKGCWGIESVPRDGDEYGAARKTIALIRRVLEA